MKKLLIVLGILFIGYLIFKSSYNGLIKLDEGVKTSWANVQEQYQRRMDLIKNLVQTVKGEAKFEQETLTKVIEARASATQMKIDPKDLTPEKLKQFQESQGQLSQALGRLMVISEQYPQLRANQAFRDLSASIEGTENRISIARKDYNSAVQAYNIKVRSFPLNLFAGLLGFSSRPTFEAETAAQKAPEVNFN